MKRRSSFTLLANILFIIVGWAETVPENNIPQFAFEICDNGIDDDGDGLVDCEDNDCKDFTGCDFSPNPPAEPSCSGRPTGNVFDIAAGWRSESRTASSRVTPLVADVDNDGVPEVITYDESNTLYILSGVNGEVERRVTYASDKVSGSLNSPYLAVGDVDGDGYGEIFHVEGNGWIRAFNYDLSLRWKKKMAFEFPRTPALADFNHDGVAELYYGNEIRNAMTGDIIVTGSHSSLVYSYNDWQRELNGLSVAIDILSDSECSSCVGLELVLGHVIYTVDIENGRLEEAKVMDDVRTKANYSGRYFPRDPGFYGQNFSTTAVVDFNGDGYLDVLASGATDSTMGPATVFFWDVVNDYAKTFVVSIPGDQVHSLTINNYRDLNGDACNGSDDCTWRRGIGPLGVANIDNDPEPECFFSSGASLYAINRDMQLEWANHEDFWESSSGVTGATAFDFDGDGASEIIYRDQVDLYIVDGTTGRPVNGQYRTFKCSSQTLIEYPVVADVDGDGEAELIVSCSDYENNRYEDTNTGGTRNQQGHIRTYEAAQGTFWLPARSVWNQIAYYHVNVNDDLSIPRHQPPHHRSSTTSCSDPHAPNRFPLNRFLSQARRVDQCGRPVIPLARLDFVGEGVRIHPPTCPDEAFSVTLTFENSGDKVVRRPIPFAFYAQAPDQPHRNADANPWLDTVHINVPGGVPPGERVDTTVVIRGVSGQFTLYVSMNDVGPFDRTTDDPIDNDTFYPLTQLNGPVPECDGSPTMLARAVDPVPFRINVLAYDNHRCGDQGGINRGRIKITDEHDHPLTPLSSYELSLINREDNTPVDISGSVANTDEGTFIVGLDAGTYQVTAYYQGGGLRCGSHSETVTVNRTEDWPTDEDVQPVKISDVSGCQPGTADGEAQLFINGVPPDESSYEVRWQNEQDPSDVVWGAFVTNLKPVTYEVRVTNLITGCTKATFLSMDLPLLVLDDPEIVHPVGCAPPNGSIIARVINQHDVPDVEFLLIRQSPQPDTIVNATGTFTGLGEGVYELKAFDAAHGCEGFGSGRSVTLISEDFDLITSVQSHNVSCNPTQPTGAARVRRSDNQPLDNALYTFSWYSVATEQTVGDQPEATGLAAGVYVVTVAYPNNAQSCVRTDTVTIEHRVVSFNPDQITVQATPQRSQESPDGSATVSLADAISADEYTFRWTDEGGATVSTSSTAEGLTHGAYRVVVTHTASGCNETYPVVVGNNVPASPVGPVSFGAVADVTYGDAPFILPVINPNQRPIALRVVEGNVSLEGSTVHVEGAGAVVIEAVPVDSVDRRSEVARVTFTVHQQTQVISTFDTEAINDSTFLLRAEATSQLPVVFRVLEGDARIVDSILTVRTSGIAVVEASQAGNRDYQRATPVEQTVAVTLVTGLTDVGKPAGVRVYPNPSNDGIFRIDHPQTYRFWVTDGAGTLVRTGYVGKNGVIDLRRVSSGMYFLKLVGYHQTSHHTLIKR